MSDCENVIVAGEEFEIEFLFRDDITDENVSITNYSPSVQLRKERDDGEKIAEWIGVGAELVKLDADSLVRLTMSPTTTEALKFKKAYLDLYMTPTLPGAKPIRTEIVELEMHRGVTRNG